MVKLGINNFRTIPRTQTCRRTEDLPGFRMTWSKR